MEFSSIVLGEEESRILDGRLNEWEKDMLDAANKIKVVYIVGSGRSGSTLLSTLLGEIPGFVDCGEIRHVWGRGVQENRKCGCGVAFKNCKFWEGVLWKAFGKDLITIAGGMEDTTFNAVRFRNYIKLIKASGGTTSLGLNDLYLGNLEKLYSAISSGSGNKIIIDASKLPSYAKILTMVPTIDLFFIHLVRDPRAVVYSWQREKSYEPNSERLMERISPARASLMWKLNYITSRNVMKFLPHIFIRYEDLAHNPKGLIGQILHEINSWCSFGGEMYSGVPTSKQIAHHTVAGNPMRFGDNLTVTLDDAWIRELGRVNKLIATSICAPEMRSCGYK